MAAGRAPQSTILVFRSDGTDAGMCNLSWVSGQGAYMSRNIDVTRSPSAERISEDPSEWAASEASLAWREGGIRNNAEKPLPLR